jgi:hypothetical protein
MTRARTWCTALGAGLLALALGTGSASAEVFFDLYGGATNFGDPDFTVSREGREREKERGSADTDFTVGGPGWPRVFTKGDKQLTGERRQRQSEVTCREFSGAYLSQTAILPGQARAAGGAAAHPPEWVPGREAAVGPLLPPCGSRRMRQGANG